MLPSFLLISITCGYRLNIRSRAQLLPLPGQPVRHSAGAVPPGFDAPSSLAVTYFGSPGSAYSYPSRNSSSAVCAKLICHSFDI